MGDGRGICISPDSVGRWRGMRMVTTGGQPPLRRRPLVRNALSLMAAGAFARAFGMVQRILIVRLARAEALGLYHLVLPSLRTASTVSTLRLPVALTRLTAHRLARGDLTVVAQARATTAAPLVALTGV